MIELRTAVKADISKIQDLATRIWWHTYSTILSRSQIQYMLDTLYSEEAILTIISDVETELMLLYADGKEQGFVSYGKKSGNEAIYKLHKLYVLPSQQRKGFGKLLIEEIKLKLLLINIHIVELNVNRYNSAKFFYEKLGFKIVGEEDIPIGPYWMNDYVMRLDF